MENTLKKRPCTEVKYHGLYDGKSLLPYAIERNWELKRSKINYDIEILTKLNQKSITIKLSDSVPFERVHAILCKILRYECLFDGRFFKMNKYEVDGIDITAEMRENMLSYYEGKRAYTIFSQPVNDMAYKRGFCAWERYDKKALQMDQMFYYIGFGDGLTADLRLVLFSEIFEPLSEYLASLQKIQINCSQLPKQRNTKCPQCGCKYKISIPSIPSFKDKIDSVIQGYGRTAFNGDNIPEILKRTVNTRNKMLHVDAKKEDAMTGGQCGFYIRKYVELYRVVVLSELKLWNADLENELAEAINGYNADFKKLRIKKK